MKKLKALVLPTSRSDDGAGTAQPSPAFQPEFDRSKMHIVENQKTESQQTFPPVNSSPDSVKIAKVKAIPQDLLKNETKNQSSLNEFDAQQNSFDNLLEDLELFSRPSKVLKVNSQFSTGSNQRISSTMKGPLPSALTKTKMPSLQNRSLLATREDYSGKKIKLKSRNRQILPQTYIQQGISFAEGPHQLLSSQLMDDMDEAHFSRLGPKPSHLTALSLRYGERSRHPTTNKRQELIVRRKRNAFAFSLNQERAVRKTLQPTHLDSEAPTFPQSSLIGTLQQLPLSRTASDEPEYQQFLNISKLTKHSQQEQGRQPVPNNTEMHFASKGKNSQNTSKPASSQKLARFKPYSIPQNRFGSSMTLRANAAKKDDLPKQTIIIKKLEKQDPTKALDNVFLGKKSGSQLPRESIEALRLYQADVVSGEASIGKRAIVCDEEKHIKSLQQQQPKTLSPRDYQDQGQEPRKRSKDYHPTNSGDHTRIVLETHNQSTNLIQTPENLNQSSVPMSSRNSAEKDKGSHQVEEPIVYCSNRTNSQKRIRELQGKMIKSVEAANLGVSKSSAVLKKSNPNFDFGLVVQHMEQKPRDPSTNSRGLYSRGAARSKDSRGNNIQGFSSAMSAGIKRIKKLRQLKTDPRQDPSKPRIEVRPEEPRGDSILELRASNNNSKGRTSKISRREVGTQKSEGREFDECIQGVHMTQDCPLQLAEQKHLQIIEMHRVSGSQNRTSFQNYAGTTKYMPGVNRMNSDMEQELENTSQGVEDLQHMKSSQDQLCFVRSESSHSNDEQEPKKISPYFRSSKTFPVRKSTTRQTKEAIAIDSSSQYSKAGNNPPENSSRSTYKLILNLNQCVQSQSQSHSHLNNSLEKRGRRNPLLKPQKSCGAAGQRGRGYRQITESSNLPKFDSGISSQGPSAFTPISTQARFYPRPMAGGRSQENLHSRERSQTGQFENLKIRHFLDSKGQTRSVKRQEDEKKPFSNTGVTLYQTMPEGKPPSEPEVLDLPDGQVGQVGIFNLQEERNQRSLSGDPGIATKCRPSLVNQQEFHTNPEPIPSPRVRFEENHSPEVPLLVDDLPEARTLSSKELAEIFKRSKARQIINMISSSQSLQKRPRVVPQKICSKNLSHFKTQRAKKTAANAYDIPLPLMPKKPVGHRLNYEKYVQNKKSAPVLKKEQPPPVTQVVNTIQRTTQENSPDDPPSAFQSSKEMSISGFNAKSLSSLYFNSRRVIQKDKGLQIGTDDPFSPEPLVASLQASLHPHQQPRHPSHAMLSTLRANQGSKLNSLPLNNTHLSHKRDTKFSNLQSSLMQSIGAIPPGPLQGTSEMLNDEQMSEDCFHLVGSGLHNLTTTTMINRNTNKNTTMDNSLFENRPSHQFS